jgi:hypothetical protein
MPAKQALSSLSEARHYFQFQKILKSNAEEKAKHARYFAILRDSFGPRYGKRAIKPSKIEMTAIFIAL